MTDPTYRAILTEWLLHGRTRVDWCMNRAYAVRHPFRIRRAPCQAEEPTTIT